MPLPNRVRPDGLIVSAPDRGTLMGNRGGCFHTSEKTLKRRPFASTQWICCSLTFKERHRKVMSPGRYTELFFLDEATALTAGHRPCFECRRKDARFFADIWRARTKAAQPPSAPDMDAVLHLDRIDPRTHEKITYFARPRDLPDLAFVTHKGNPHIVWRGTLRRWTLGGYDPAPLPLSDDPAPVLTPATIVSQLAAGYPATHHPSLYLDLPPVTSA